MEMDGFGMNLAWEYRAFWELWAMGTWSSWNIGVKKHGGMEI